MNFDDFAPKVDYKKRRGLLVTTKNGIKGRTYHEDDLIGGKKPVYTEIDGKPVRLLCDPETLTINGFID